jgi:hypothetical protein
MHIIRVLLTPQEHPAGEQWVTHQYGTDEFDLVLALLRDLEARNVPYEHHFED